MAKRQRGGNRGDSEKFVDELFESLAYDPQGILALICTMLRDIGSDVRDEDRTLFAQMAMKIQEAEEIAKRTYPEGTRFDG